MNKYNPMSKEFREKCKILGITGNQLIQKYKEEGKIVNTIKLNREHHSRTYEKYRCNNSTEYSNLCAQRLGYKDRKERRNEYEWTIGIREESDKFHPTYSGKIAEKIIAKTILPMKFGNIKLDMGYLSPFDFLMENDIKIDVKSAKFRNNGYNFLIDENKIPDYFLLVGFNNDENLNVSHIWLVHRDDIINERKVCNRCSIWISKKELYRFDRYELKEELSYLRLHNKIRFE